MRRALARLPARSSTLWHTPLPHRGVLQLGGRDSRKLLQGLITNDIEKLDEGPQYAAFLNAQGRVLYEAFLVSGTDGTVLIDADASAIPAIAAHLKRYKLRSKVTIRDSSDEFAVHALCGSDALDAAASAGGPSEGGAWADPRLPALGCRLLQPAGTPLAVPGGSAKATPEFHALQLALLGVPDGGQAYPQGESFPLEGNIELLNGVSFKKGCYLGQELTARTHFRGVVRKRLVPMVASPLADAVAADLAAETPQALPALGHLPAYERSLAAVLLSSEAEGAWEGVWEQAREGEGATKGEGKSDVAAAISMNDAKGKGVAKFRAFEPSLGVGLALCRLTALGGQKVGGALTDGSGALSAVPLRPSWWPDEVDPPDEA